MERNVRHRAKIRYHLVTLTPNYLATKRLAVNIVDPVHRSNCVLTSSTRFFVRYPLAFVHETKKTQRIKKEIINKK